MNRKKLMAWAIAAVALIAVIVLAVQPKQTEKEPEATETASAEMQNTANETKDPATAENEVNQEEPDENTEEAEIAENSDEKTDNSTGSDETESADATTPLIPEENVQMGVVQGEDIPSVEGSPDVPVQNVTPTQPTQPAPEASQPKPEGDTLPADFDITKLTYEQYNAMSGAQQKLVIEMFGSVEDFMRWYRAVEALYQAEHPDIEIGADGVINAEDLIK